MLTDNIATRLKQWAQHQANHDAFIFKHYPSASNSIEYEDKLTFSQLDARAGAIAELLTAKGLTNKNAILLFPPGLQFIEAFFGCLYAGVIPVPLSPPLSDRDFKKFIAVLSNAQAAAVLTCTALFDKITSTLPLIAKDVDIIDIENNAVNNLWQLVIPKSNIALIQYTSGSTGTPKGVMVTHTGIMDNERLIQAAFEHSQQTVALGWLPMFHDMGLIGNLLQPLYLGTTCVLMSPIAFVQEPIRWLKLITQYRATTSGGPNFGYALCARRVKEEDKKALDLSSWTLAFTGAEPVRHSTIAAFAKAFECCGFDPKAFYPCYGLAEATLFVTGVKKLNGISTLTVDNTALGQSNIIPVPVNTPKAITLTSCGYTRDNMQVAIVNPETGLKCDDNRVGEIWITSDSNAQGYWQQVEQSKSVFNAHITNDTARHQYLRTGDLGFIHHSELYVTGRVKDVIIIRGKNIYPQDVEFTIESTLNLPPDTTAAISMDIADEEKLVVLVGLKQVLSAEDTLKLCADVIQAVTETHGVRPHDVFTLDAKELPRGSSGKLQRFLCKQLYAKAQLSSNIKETV